MSRDDANFRQLCEAVPNLVWVFEADGRPSYFNRLCFEFTGTPYDDRAIWEPAGWRAVIHPDDQARAAEVWTQSLSTGQGFETEYRIRRADGAYRWFLARAEPLWAGDGSVARWFGTCTDIDELKQERTLREGLISALTHDLRNPLAMIRLNAQMMARHAGDPEAVRKSAKMILGGVDRADLMIRDLLDAMSIRGGKRLPLQVAELDLEALIRAVLAELRLLHGDRFRLESPGPLRGTWDAQALRRIVENLADNALKYGGADTPVTVSLAPASEGGGATIAVHNEGEAIPAEERAALFELFHRSRAAERSGKKGWGIGLAIVRGLVDAHRGEISVESAEGAGTTFRVRLPG
jgi:PAS domain S-box-containing protein